MLLPAKSFAVLFSSEKKKLLATIRRKILAIFITIMIYSSTKIDNGTTRMCELYQPVFPFARTKKVRFKNRVVKNEKIFLGWKHTSERKEGMGRPGGLAGAEGVKRWGRKKPVDISKEYS